jgi:uncharacterized SAM-binding protein YcdF (DUF218 family)
MSKRIYLLFLLLGGIATSCVFFGPSEKKLYSLAEIKKPYDVIIVPGVPFDSVLGDWNFAMKGRVYWSAYLYEKGIAKNIIYSGAAVYTPYVEAEIMRMFGEQLGIPAEHIYVETKAEHSTENVYYSYYLAKNLGFEKIAIATDPFQAKMLKGYPGKIKLKIDFIPFVMDSLRTMEKKSSIKIDAEKAKMKGFSSIADRQSRFKRIWGTLGKNVKRDEEDVRNKHKTGNTKHKTE